MESCSVLRQRVVAAVLVCALVAPSGALAQSKKEGGQPSRKGAIAGIVVGWLMGGLGAVTYRHASEAAPSREATAGHVAGGAMMALGGVMVVTGIVRLVKRHKPDPAATPDQQHPSDTDPSGGVERKGEQRTVGPSLSLVTRPGAFPNFGIGGEDGGPSARVALIAPAKAIPTEAADHGTRITHP